MNAALLKQGFEIPPENFGAAFLLFVKLEMLYYNIQCDPVGKDAVARYIINQLQQLGVRTTENFSTPLDAEPAL